MATMRTTKQIANTPCVAPKPGTLTGYKQHRCRCKACSQAARDWQQNYYRRSGYGTWKPFVSNEPVRAHVATLRASGMGATRIAKLAGVAPAVVGALVWGRNDRRTSDRIRPDIAAKILAVEASLADGVQVDATGSRRRTQALAAIGYPVAVQARMLGREQRNHHYVMVLPQVTVRTARDVADLYERLSGTPALAGTSATRAIRWAARKGWAPPAAWEDIDIDDPAARPQAEPDPDPDFVDVVLVDKALAGDDAAARALTKAELAAAAATGLARGMTATRLAGLLHRTNAAINALAEKAAA